MIDGLGPQGLADRLHISVDNAKQLIAKFFSAFPNIHKCLERSANYGLTHGHIKTIKPFNRVRYFPDYDPNDNASRGSVSRRSKNTRIQGEQTLPCLKSVKRGTSRSGQSRAKSYRNMCKCLTTTKYS